MEGIEMKNLAKLVAMFSLLIVGMVQAQEAAPMPVPEHGHFVEAAPIALYTNVKYKDCDEMSPCAQPKIIAVKDPCACYDPCSCCGPKCVYIQICVPTCGCELISCKRNGDRIRYDYGKYAVDVRIKRDHIEVDYQD